MSKIQNMGERSKNVHLCRMCLNLNDYQFKISRYNSRSIPWQQQIKDIYTKAKKKENNYTHTKRNLSNHNEINERKINRELEKIQK